MLPYLRKLRLLRTGLIFGGLLSIATGLRASPWPEIALRADVPVSLGVEPAAPRNDGPVVSWTCKTGSWVEFRPPALSDAKGLDFYVFYADQRPGRMQLTVLNTARELIARVNLFPDGRGWRRVELKFDEDTVEPRKAKDTTPTFLVLNVIEGAPSTVYFAKPTWLVKPGFRRTPDLHCPSILGSRTDRSPTYYKEWFNTFKNPQKSGTAAVTADLNVLAERYDRWVMGNGKPSDPIGNAIAVAQSTWIIKTRETLVKWGLHRQGIWIRPVGNVVPTTNEVLALLTPVALDWRRTQNPERLEEFWLLLDYLEQQGFGACVPADPTTESMPFVRLKLAYYAHAVALVREPLISTNRVHTVRRNLRWMARIGEWDADKHYEINADVLRGEAVPRFIYCLLAPDPATRAWEFGRFSAWLSNSLVVTPNLEGLIKPDFTVNHHRNAYLVSYGPHALLAAATLATWLEGTEWGLSSDTKERIEQCADALIGLSRGFGLPIGTRGRFPWQTRSMTENLPLYLVLSSKPTFSGRHAATARDLMKAMGPAETAELLSSKSTRLFLIWMNSIGIDELATQAMHAEAAPAAPLPAFRAFNWAGVAAVQKDNWSAFVSGFSKWVFDYEVGISPVENHWGRYLRYGTVELSSGPNPHDDHASGWAIKNGWDWSLIPGATTLLLPPAELSVTSASARNRHRNFSDRTFCAGLAGPDGYGVFGLDLNDRVYPGNLQARKSVFLAGDSLLCLGSGISSNLADVGAVTTLFQFGRGGSVKAQSPGPIIDVSGTLNKPAVFTDPAGNEFKIIDGSRVFRRQGVQTGPGPDGKISSGQFDTLWLAHGVRPTDQGYAYVINPATGSKPAKLPEFKVMERSAFAHIVRYPAASLTAYVLFEPGNRDGMLGADRPCLLWEKDDVAGRKDIAVCDPDLNFPNGAGIDDTSSEPSKPTVVKVTVPGRWKLASPASGVEAKTLESETLLEVTCLQGSPVMVNLVRY